MIVARLAAMASTPTFLSDARALLGLTGPTDAETLAAAFRKAVKAARPDLPGGDAERFRRIIAAYRLIQAAEPPRPALPAPAPPRTAATPVRLTPRQALTGAVITVSQGRRKLRVRVPAGMRNADRLRLAGAGRDGADLFLPVLIRAAEGLSVLGDDLFMTAAVPARALSEGGRVEIDTHAGPRSAWIVPGMTPAVRLRLRGLGLPARGSRPEGHLFVTVEPVADAPSAAEDLLARFGRVWTPDRIAA